MTEHKTHTFWVFIKTNSDVTISKESNDQSKVWQIYCFWVIKPLDENNQKGIGWIVLQ